MQRRRRRSDEGGSGSEEDYDSDQSYDPEAEEEDDNNNEEQPSVTQNNIVSENKQVIDEEEKEEEIDYVETIEDKKTEKDEARVEQAPSPDQKGRTSQRGRGTRPRGANNNTPRRPSSSIDNRPPLKGSRKGRGRGRGDFNRSSDSTTVEAVTADSQVEGDAKSNFKKRREKRRPTKDFNASNTPGDAKNRDNRPQLKGTKMKSSRRQDKFDPNNPNAPQDVIGAPQQKTFNKHRFDRKNQQQQQQQQQQGTGSKRYSVQRQQEFTYDQLQSQQNGARKPRSRYNQDEHYDPNAHYNYPDNGLYSSYMYANYGYEMYADYNVYHTPSSTYIPPEYLAQFYNNGGGTQKVSNYQDSPKSTFGGKLNVHAKEFAPKRVRNLNPVENTGSDKQEQPSQTSEAS
jgi:hypothetical protein